MHEKQLEVYNQETVSLLQRLQCKSDNSTQNKGQDYKAHSPLLFMIDITL